MVWDVVFVRIIWTAKKPCHLFFRKFSSVNSTSMGLSSKDNNLAVMSSRTNIMITPPFWSRSKRNGEEYPGILNCLSGKESPSFVSEITIISTFTVIWSVGISNLFLKELMLRWARTIRWRFFVRIFVQHQINDRVDQV